MVDLFTRKLRRAAIPETCPAASGGLARLCALNYQRALELCERQQHSHHQPPHRAVVNHAHI